MQDELSTERWLPVVGYESLYEVSDRGQVRRIGRRSLKINTSDRYARVRLSKGSQARTHLVHRLVLEAFVGPCPDGLECRHFDGIDINNVLENLSWSTHVDNESDKRRHGTINTGDRNGMRRHPELVRRGDDNHSTKTPDALVDTIRSRAASGDSQRTLAREYGVTQPTISRVINSRKKESHAA